MILSSTSSSTHAKATDRHAFDDKVSVLDATIGKNTDINGIAVARNR